jgi:endonuclease/exonuclease/phosphatase family metal-dependent hydrolase
MKTCPSWHIGSGTKSWIFTDEIMIKGQEIPIKVMTFNIRYDNPADGVNRWENRRGLVTEKILEISPDLIGMQEVLERQLDYLGEHLPGYGHFGVGRDDGKTGGEYVPVLYNKDRYALMENGTFWLSPTPGDTGSVGWDAALTRICTWGKFQDLSSGREFYFLNTHFDHMGDTARAESAKLILDFINKETTGLPVILTGDFNCSPDEAPYRLLTAAASGLSDACPASGRDKDCDEGTFNGWGTEKDPPRIDFIFFNKYWKIKSYQILKVKEGDMYISDHWPVVSSFIVEN